MDLINREYVLTIATSSCLDLDSYDDTEEFCNEVKELPSAFEGMTNNEVHKAIFGFELDPRYLVTDDTCICGENCPVCPLYDKTCNNRNFAEWLDSPYQKGGEA